MFTQVFNQLDNILREEAGCTTELDYTEQSSWLLFLKYLDDLEGEKRLEAELKGTDYRPIISDEYRWANWAAPKDSSGNFDHNVALTGPDLIEYVDGTLMPYLKSFKGRAESPDTIEYKIGEIFHEVGNKFQSGYSLRDALEQVDQLTFGSAKEKHELSQIYEEKIKRMGNAGRNGGEYYTPRPLISAMTKVIDPKIEEKVYDGAVGSGGFLCSAYEYILNSKKLSATEFEKLQNNTLFGKEKKSLPYIIGTMNMILHGIEAPNIIHENSLEQNLEDIQDEEKVDVILANPPFGGKERAEVQKNFIIKSSESAYMFLQHFIKKLKPGGRCGMIIKNTFLSNDDLACTTLRKQLVEDCNLYAVLDLPKGTFVGTGEQTVALFFEKKDKTDKIWYYQLNPGRNLGKTNPLNNQDLKEFLNFISQKKTSRNSWIVDVKSLDKKTWELTVNNPNRKDTKDERTPEQIIKEIEDLDKESEEIFKSIKEIISEKN